MHGTVGKWWHGRCRWLVVGLHRFLNACRATVLKSAIKCGGRRDYTLGLTVLLDGFRAAVFAGRLGGGFTACRCHRVGRHGGADFAGWPDRAGGCRVFRRCIETGDGRRRAGDRVASGYAGWPVRIDAANYQQHAGVQVAGAGVCGASRCARGFGWHLHPVRRADRRDGAGHPPGCGDTSLAGWPHADAAAQGQQQASSGHFQCRR